MNSVTTNTETVSDTIAATAVAKPVTNFTNKSRLAHNMMRDIFWERKTIEDICKEHNLSKEQLIIGFAVFGVQAMEIVEAKTMDKELAYRAMGMNKDGYDDAEHWMAKNVEEVKEDRRAARIARGKKVTTPAGNSGKL